MKDRETYFLPKMSPKDLYKRDFQGRNLAVEEDAGQIELDLKADVDICSVYL